MQTSSSHLRGWWECSPCLCSAGHSGSVLLCSWCESHAHISFLTVLLGLVFLLLVPISYRVSPWCSNSLGQAGLLFWSLLLKGQWLVLSFLHGTHLPDALQSPVCMAGVKQNLGGTTWFANLANFAFYPSWIIISEVCESFILGLVLAGPALYLWTVFATQNSLESESCPWIFTSLESEEKCPE